MNQIPTPQELIEDANRYFCGNGVTASIANGIKCLELAAKQGSDEANYRLGVVYSNGRIVPFDADRAMYHLLAASENGHLGAKIGVAQISIHNKDYDAAFGIFESLADTKHPSVLMNLAQLYLLGRGTSVNTEKAIEVLLIAAQEQFPDASYQLALMYYQGVDVTKDLAKAVSFAEQAVELKYAPSFALLAGMLLEQKQDKATQERALSLYQTAEDHGTNDLSDVISSLQQKLQA